MNPYRSSSSKEQESTPSKTKQSSVILLLARCCCAPRAVVVTLLLLVSIFILAFHLTHADIGSAIAAAKGGGIVSKLASTKMFASSSQGGKASASSSASPNLRGMMNDAASEKRTDIHSNKMIHNNIKRAETLGATEADPAHKKASDPPPLKVSPAITERTVKVAAAVTAPPLKVSPAITERMVKVVAAEVKSSPVPGSPDGNASAPLNKFPVVQKRVNIKDREAISGLHDALDRHQQERPPLAPLQALTDHHVPARYMHKSESSLNSIIAGNIGRLSGGEGVKMVVTTEHQTKQQEPEHRKQQLLVQESQEQQQVQLQDITSRSAPAAATVEAAAAPKRLGNFCDSPGLDPYRGWPVDSFTPPVKADFKSQTQWRTAVDKMMASVKAMNVGGSVLRQHLDTETKKLEELRFSLFCQYGLEAR